MSRQGSRRTTRSSFGKDVEFQLIMLHEEIEYSPWWNKERLFQFLHSIPEDKMWNSMFCILVLAAIVWHVTGLDGDPIVVVLDILYNVVYALHVLGLAYNTFVTIDTADSAFYTLMRFVADLVSYLHYVLIIKNYDRVIKFCCYYLRLHRPFHYLWELNSYNLNGSVIGTTLKFMYIFAVLRITLAVIWAEVDSTLHYYGDPDEFNQWALVHTNTERQSKMLGAIYFVDKMFLPIGPSFPPARDIERIIYLAMAIIGCLVVTGSAVASLSLVIGMYMRPEEAFRARYRLIMKEMNETNVPTSLRDKVQSFYKMYWHKQRAVSETELLKIFPPTLATLIYTDIYFEATQRSRILCDLTFEFLSEVAKKMTTIHYIPGDAIIKRNTTKSSMIFITYGDVEMLTAEDDSTPILRMTRGTMLSPCAGAVPAGCCNSQVTIRAATFCTAHVLDASDLWRVARKYGSTNEQSETMLDCFYEHFDKVKKYHVIKVPENAKYKSSILSFRTNMKMLIEAKDADGKLLLSHPEVFLEIAGSYIMRNRSESSVDETDAICLKSTFPCILQPESSLQLFWQVVVSLFTMTSAVVYPYYLVFVVSRPPEFAFFDNVANVIDVIDVIVHLSTGAHVEEGVPLNFSQTSSQQLRSIWFVLDVTAILPLLAFVGDGHYDGIQKLLKLPKVFRNLKALEELWVYNSNQIRFISFLLLKLILCYLIATAQQGFMCFRLGHCVMKNFTEAPHWYKSPLDDNTDDGRVAYGLYWAFSVMTFTSHKENFGIDVWDNVIYTILLIEVCIAINIFIEAVYSATIMVTTSLRDDYDSTIANVKDFMIKNDVEPQMRKRFITYLELCWYTDKAYSITNKRMSIFHDLPPHVYQEIVSKKRSKYLLTIPFMKLFPKADLKTISSTARLFYTSPNEILMNTGDITNEIFVIKQGFCEVINPDTREVVMLLTAKGHFGVLECLLRLPAYYTVRVVTHVQVFSISKKKLGKMIDIPQIKSSVKYARSLPEYHNLKFRRDAFLYFEPPVPPPNRETFRLPKKYEMDTEFLRPFNRLGFFSVLRYVFPRFTIRPDGKYMHRYEWFRGVCALLSAMVYPCYGYLVLQWLHLRWISWFLDICAYFDIFQRLLVGYYNEIGILVYHPAATAAHYIKGTFIIDFLACAPLEFLESEKRERDLIGSEYMFRRSTTRQLLRMNRLIQMYRLPSAINSLTDVIERRDIHLVIQAIPYFMTLLNVLTFCVIINSVDLYGYEGWGWHIVPLPDKGGSWLTLFADVYRFNMTETPWNLHLAAYSWVVYETTTTGYDCFNPTNQSLMMVLFAGMVIGAMIITYYSVCIISIRANVNKELAGFQENLKDIMVFMKNEELDENLQKEVLNYYAYNWDKTGGVDCNRLLKLCDQLTLRTDAILHIYGPTFAKCPFLTQCDISLLRIMGREVRSLYMLRGMHIIELDDVITDMYFLVYGQVQVRITYEDRSQMFNLYRGSVFGNLDPITTVRSHSTIVAISRIHILQIKSIHFHRILADFSKVQSLFKRHRGDNENFIRGTSADPRTSKDRASSTKQFHGRKSIVKHLFFRDKYLQIYLILVSLSCVHADVYNAGFQNNTMAMIIILYILDFGFSLKILMQFLLPYLIVTDKLRIALLRMRHSYFKVDFKYDILSCIPIELFSFISTEHRWMMFSWLRLNRLLRIMTVYKCLKRHQERLNINLTITTVFSVLIWFSLFIHTSACLWYFIGTMEDLKEPNSSWLHDGQKTPGKRRSSLTSGSYNGTWCDNHYLCSVYFVLTTFTQNGVGDIMAKKQSEVVFVCIFQIISTMVYMVYVGEFSNIIQYQYFRNFGYYCKWLELQHYLKNNRVSRNLATVVNKYALHLWREARGNQVPYFLASAPDAIKLKVMSAAYMDHLRNHLIFDKCEPAFLRQLVGKLKMYYYNRDMYIVKEGEITDCMYIVHTGQVLETSLTSTHYKTLIAGRSFGLIEGLTPETPFKNSYKTVLKSQILMLSYQDWSYLLKHFPDSAEAIYSRLDFDDDSDYPHYKPPMFVRGRQPSTPFWDFDQTHPVKTATLERRRSKPNETPRRRETQPTISEPLMKRIDSQQQTALNKHDAVPQSSLRRTVESEIELAELNLDRKPSVNLKEVAVVPYNPEFHEANKTQDTETYTRRAPKFTDAESARPSLVQLANQGTLSSAPSAESLQISLELTPNVRSDGKRSASTRTTPSIPSSESLQASVDLSQKIEYKTETNVKSSALSSESLRGIRTEKNEDVKKLLKEKKGETSASSGKVVTAASDERQKPDERIGWSYSWLSTTSQSGSPTTSAPESAPQPKLLQPTATLPLATKEAVVQPARQTPTMPTPTMSLLPAEQTTMQPPKAPQPTKPQATQLQPTLSKPPPSKTKSILPLTSAPQPLSLQPKSQSTVPQPRPITSTPLSTAPQPTESEPATSVSAITAITYDDKQSIASAVSLTRSLKPPSKMFDISTALEREQTFNSDLFSRQKRREESNSSVITKAKGSHSLKAEGIAASSNETIASTSSKDSYPAVTRSRQVPAERDLQEIYSEIVLEEEEEERSIKPPYSKVKPRDSKEKIIKSAMSPVDFNVDDHNEENNQVGVSNASQSTRFNRRLVRVRYEEDKSKSEEDTYKTPILPTQIETDGDDVADTESLNSQRERDKDK